MKKTQKLVLSALFAAFTCIATMIIKFPTPTFGYVHLGDCMVLLCGIILGPLPGAFAAGLGSALSDLFSGYAVWAPATFVIKALTAMIAGAVFRKTGFYAERPAKRQLSLIFGGILGEAFMIFGYFVYEAALAAFGSGSFSQTVLMAGILSSASGIPFNLVQGITGIILSTVLYPLLRRIPILQPSRPLKSE